MKRTYSHINASNLNKQDETCADTTELAYCITSKIAVINTNTILLPSAGTQQGLSLIKFIFNRAPQKKNNLLARVRSRRFSFFILYRHIDPAECGLMKTRCNVIHLHIQVFNCHVSAALSLGVQAQKGQTLLSHRHVFRG
jgi:hypothetical protein